MPSLKEIIEREQAPRKTPKDKCTVRLTKMGSFLRAYDWSAWLLKRNGVSLKPGLDTTGGNSHLFVGFPLTSADKFKPEGAEETKVEDGTIDAWILSETQFPPEQEISNLDEEYAAWQKETLDKLVAEQKSKKEQKKDKTENIVKPQRTKGRETQRDDQQDDEPWSAQPLRLTDIARQVLQFQVQQHSPEECQRFIGTLQREVLQLL